MARPHSTNNYTVGKGILTIAEWSNGAIGSYIDIGNCNSLEVEPTIERLPHYSSRSGFRIRDKNPVISTDYTLSFELDEMASTNLAKYLMGNIANGMTISGLQNTDKEYALKFTEDNPAGPNKIWNFWKVTLEPGGPLQLIGDGTTWATMTFSGEGVADTAGHATSPYFTVGYSSTTTTTTA